MAIVYLSIGSNLGNRFGNCQNGILQLIGSTKSVMIKQSPFYETEPVGYKNQGWFINGVVKIETRLEPSQLLKNVKAVETNFGRDSKQIRFGPRPLDLDILLYDDLVKNTADLVIPHPRMHERRFVLRPLCDIAAEVVHPILKKSIARLLKDLGDCEQKIALYS